MRRLGTGTALVVSASLLVACAGEPQGPISFSERPPYIRGDVVRSHYDGSSNDLLTAGLGKSGLALSAPMPPDPAWTEAEKLRRIAIHGNYRALVDPTPDGGFGVIYGPNVTIDGQATQDEGKIAGDEFMAYADDGSGRENVTMMVQVPDRFDPANACLVTAPSSGSRGVYGAIATAGEWGLKHHCAVAYTDKGTGTGAHDLQNDRVNLMRGERAAAAAAGASSNFTASLSPAERAAFTAASPNRYAFKHAHSQQNPERDWGRDVLRSIEFAFFVLNEKYGPGRVTRRNTIVIASSVSNGGGASIRAAELDRSGLIDAVVVGEPNATPVYDDRFTIVQGGRPPLQQHSRGLFDYVTLVNVFQGCASVANPAAPANDAQSQSPARCAVLRREGMLRADTLPEQAAEAQRIINDYGILPEQNAVQPGHWRVYVPQSIAMTYGNAYGRFSVADRLCDYSFAAVDANGAPTALATDALLFGTSNGIPPTGGVSLVNDAAEGGAKEDRRSNPDQNLRGALCLRGLALSRDPRTQQQLAARSLADARRIAVGGDEVRASGDLHGLPAIIVTGRDDAVLPPNHTSRPYLGRNRLVEGERSKLRYIEVTNAQHLDVLLGAFKATPDKSGYDELFVPLHPYFIQAMDLMYAHLKRGAPLPPSQVVHTMPRGKGSDGKVPPITPANLPPISAAPPPDALVTFAANQVRIPD
jgi:hydroxybutyrate-dimer hydrolase